MVEWTAPNHTLRQQLAQNPTIECLAHEQQGTNSLPSSVSSTLTPLMLQRILQLATDLRIPEAHAVSLYAEVAQNTQAIQGLTKSKFVVHQQQQTSLGNNNKYNLHTLMRDFYFQERHLRLQTLLLLVQSRLSSSQLRLEATDFLLDQGGDLAKELIQVIRDYTMRIQQLQQELASTLKSTNQPFGGGASTSTTTSTSTTPSPPPSFAQVHLRFCQTERHVAAETLFFMAYHTQLFPHEMAALLDLIRDLTADLVPPSPFANVPSPYMPSQPPPPANTSHVPPYAATTNTAAAFYYLQEKQPWQWQHDFVTQTHQSGQPQLLQCVSLLVVAAMAAMDTQQILYDRQSHGPNAFGKVSIDSAVVVNIYILPRNDNARIYLSLLYLALTYTHTHTLNSFCLFCFVSFMYYVLGK